MSARRLGGNTSAGLPRRRSAPVAWAAGVGLVVALLGAQARADEGAPSMRVPVLPKYGQECAACHIAYPPGLMSAAAWQRVMANLPRHYGTDASLDPATVRALADWLTANAARDGRRSEPPPDDRITRSAWFIRQHREVAPATWKLPSVRSAANCAACHTQADQGDFNEHHVRIPR